MTRNEVVNTALAAGLCLLENGAETRRVEDTAERIVVHYLGEQAEVIAMLTGITVCCGDISKSARVKSRGMNIRKITEVNSLSRDICENRLSFEAANRRLCEIKRLKPYGFAVKAAAYCVCCCFFSGLFGGGVFDMAAGFLTGLILYAILCLLRQKQSSPFIVTLTGGATVALSALMLECIGMPCNAETVVIGSIMPLVPGMGVTNALRDMSQGDYLSGGARFFEAVITALAVAAGAGGVMQIGSVLL